MKRRVLVSACLVGIRCRYDGKILHLRRKYSSIFNPQSSIFNLQSAILVPVCPEQLAGFPTPRLPIVLRGNRAFDSSGKDVTRQLRRGAEQVLKIARLTHCSHAWLKSRSPSCDEHGVTTRLLRRKGIAVVIEESH